MFLQFSQDEGGREIFVSHGGCLVLQRAMNHAASSLSKIRERSTENQLMMTIEILLNLVTQPELDTVKELEAFKNIFGDILSILGCLGSQFLFQYQPTDLLMNQL